MSTLLRQLAQLQLPKDGDTRQPLQCCCSTAPAKWTFREFLGIDSYISSERVSKILSKACHPINSRFVRLGRGSQSQEVVVGTQC